MDLIEFCYARVAKAIPMDSCYYNHSHLHFDVEQGKVEFRDTINQVFSRHELAFELLESDTPIRFFERKSPP